MQLLTFLSHFGRSHQKLLRKRRKIRIKNRGVSKKYLKEQRKVMNYTFERKIMEIQKDLDKKKSQNHHINQIIQQLFYPDVKPTEQSLIEKKITIKANTIHPNLKSIPQYYQNDVITQKIEENLIPNELFKLHKQNEQQFNLSHYIFLLKKLNYCGKNIQKIKKILEQKWNRQNSKNINIKNKKPNFVLLQNHEIVRHQLWPNVVSGIQKNMKKITQHLPTFNQYIQVTLLIYSFFRFVPANLYQLILKTNIAAYFQQIQNRHISPLLNLLRLRNHVRFQPHIKIQNPQANIENKSQIHFIQLLARQVIINYKQYKAVDFINIFKIIFSYQKKIQGLSQDLWACSQQVFTYFINELSFEEVELYLSIYCYKRRKINYDFLQIIKFDLYRKSQNCNNAHGLIKFIKRMRGRKIIFQNSKFTKKSSQIQLDGGQAFILKVCQGLSKLINNLKDIEIIQLINAYYDNQITKQSLLMIVSTQFTKKCLSNNIKQSTTKIQKRLSLQSIAQSFFKLTILGYRSKILSKMIFQNFNQNYHKLSKIYDKNQILLLPSEIKQTKPVLNFKKIHLQQCLIMVIWGVVKQISQNKEWFDTKFQQQLLQLIPIQVDSIEPLIIELILNINFELKRFNLFPQIAIPVYLTNIFPENRLSSYYCYDFSKSMVQNLMAEQAKLSQKFIENYNISQGLFLKQRWSKINTYQIQHYIEFCQLQLKKSEQRGICYFNEKKNINSSILQKRKLIIKNYINQKQKIGQFKQQKQKIYDLL